MQFITKTWRQLTLRELGVGDSFIRMWWTPDTGTDGFHYMLVAGAVCTLKSPL
jgi:hypothetical protein